TLGFMQGGEIVIPKMKNMPIVDVIAMLTPEAKIKTIGMRPGEKLHEVLITEYEAPRTKDVPNAYIVQPEFDNANYTKWLNKKPSASRNFIFASDNAAFRLTPKEAQAILKL